MVILRRTANEALMNEQMPVDGKKKGMPALAWVGIGCGTVLLIGLVVVAMLIGWCKRSVNEFTQDMEKNPERKVAEMVINLNPDYSVVSTNDETGEMTIKEDKTGKVTTFSYKDIQDGKFMMTGSDGTSVAVGKVKIEDLPAWVALPAGTTEISGVSGLANGKQNGVVTFTTKETPEAIVEFYEKSASSWGSLSSSKNNFNLNGAQKHSLSLSNSTQKLDVLATSNGGDTTVTLTFGAK